MNLAVPMHAACMDIHQFERFLNNLLNVSVSSMPIYVQETFTFLVCAVHALPSKFWDQLCTSMLWAFSVNWRVVSSLVSFSLCSITCAAFPLV